MDIAMDQSMTFPKVILEQWPTLRWSLPEGVGTDNMICMTTTIYVDLKYK